MVPDSPEVTDETNLDFIEHSMKSALAYLQHEKGESRNERSRYMAICVTELEKVIAYFMYYLAE